MNSFCPLIGDECRGQKCMMWKTQSCLIVDLVRNYAELGSRPSLNKLDWPVESQVSEKIKLATAEELANELVSFIKKEFPLDMTQPDRMTLIGADIFWESQGMDPYSLFDYPGEIGTKFDKANALALEQLKSEQKVIIVERLEREKADLPSLVKTCADWARDRALKSIINADIDTFCLESNIEILEQTKRSLKAMTNTALHSIP